MHSEAGKGIRVLQLHLLDELDAFFISSKQELPVTITSLEGVVKTGGFCFLETNKFFPNY